MAKVLVENVTRRFGAHLALDDVSIAFPDGGFYALLGPSGSGKTTLLRMIAGFDFPERGRIVIGDESVERVPVEKRRIGMMFQNYALFPNMSVAENVGFGLWTQGVARAEVEERVAATLGLVQLGTRGERRPHQLSGGQRQRVALARAIVTRPRVLLLDEPLSALDKALRLNMQIELKRIQREVGITTIFVTHDQDEALTMSDRVGILRDGRLVQEGTPEEIYNNPSSRFAATFLGDANIFEGISVSGGLELSDGSLIRLRHSPTENANVTCCAVRPERIAIVLSKEQRSHEFQNELPGRVERRIFAGDASTYFIEAGGQCLRVHIQNSGQKPFTEGDFVKLMWSDACTVPLEDK